MKIMVITQMFPCKRHPTSAIFFASLMKQLSRNVDVLLIVTPRVYIPKFFSRIKKSWQKWRLDPMFTKENGLEIIRPFALTLPKIRWAGINGILMYYSLYNKLKNLIKSKRIDILLGYNLLPEGIATIRLAKKLKLPGGFWVIGSDLNDWATYNQINSYLSGKCVQQSDLVLTESKDLENKIKKLFQKTSHITTFYKGINIANFKNLHSKKYLKNKLNLKEDKKYILFVGRLIYDKGIYELAQMFCNMAKRYTEYDLILIGEEIEKSRLAAKFVQDKLLDRVHFKNIVSHREVAYYMKVADLLVLPSWSEGLPNVIMEAMAAGLPVVATEVGGIPEILKNEVTGLSVPVKNVERLTEAVVRMIKDRTLREFCTKNGQQLIYERFDVNKNVHYLYSLLEKIKYEYSNSFQERKESSLIFSN